MKFNLFLGQAVTSMNTLETAVGHALGIVVVLSYLYAVVVMVSALIQERGSGEWKLSLIRGIAIFACTGIAQILAAIFFPQLVITPSFA